MADDPRRATARPKVDFSAVQALIRDRVERARPVKAAGYRDRPQNAGQYYSVIALRNVDHFIDLLDPFDEEPLRNFGAGIFSLDALATREASLVKALSRDLAQRQEATTLFLDDGTVLVDRSRPDLARVRVMILDANEQYPSTGRESSPSSESDDALSAVATALLGLTVAAQQHEAAKEEAQQTISAAKKDGATWDQIGALMGRTGAAARQRWSEEGRAKNRRNQAARRGRVALSDD